MAATEFSPFGALLRRRRLIAGLSQEALAEHAGLSVRGIRALESGDRTAPRPETVRLLADALGLDDAARAEFVAAARPALHPPPVGPSAALPLLTPPPLPPTRLVGREREVAAVCARLRGDGVRLLTLTGPGGVGKTRLALAAATELAGTHAGGVCWVDLAPLVDPALAPATVARALGVRERGDQPLAERLRAVLRPRELLLLLDNCEHLVAAVADLVGDLLAACPRLTVLATSRERLRLRGEHEFAVLPLAIPAPVAGAGPESPVAGLAGVAAVRLFVERAAEVEPGFALRADNAAEVAAICARLDGLPLALELAAARVKLLPPPALLVRLERRLPLLTGGPRDLPTRLQTMRDAIAWSYGLLSTAEQAVFCRLAVFAGGCTLEAAERVSGNGCRVSGDGESVDANRASPSHSPDTSHPTLVTLETLASLVDKSLLRRVDEPASPPAPPQPWPRRPTWEPEPRYTMLETIREFGLERLVAEGEEAAVRRAHATSFAALVDQAASALYAGEAAWFWRLGADRDNLRAALAWLLANEAEAALRVASVLRDFWMVRGEFAEGRGWLERALARAPDASPSLRAVALFGLGHLAQFQGDYASARTALEEALALARAQEDKQAMGSAEYGLSQVNRSQGRAAEAVASATAALHLAREQGEPAVLGWRLQRLGIETHAEGDLVRAEALFVESLDLFRSLHGEWGEAHALHGLAAVARDLGDNRRAAVLYGECLAIRLAIDERSGLVDVLVGLADVAGPTGQPVQAARLLGAVETLRDELGYAPFGDAVVLADRSRAALRDRLGEARFAQAWEHGTRLTLAEAVAEALAVVDGVPGPAESGGATPATSPPRHDTSARQSRR